MFVNSDLTDLSKLFSANRARYLSSGGHAVMIQYSKPCFTEDDDLIGAIRNHDVSG